ncbi:SPOR domain-containing protein [Roseomonas sp. ACRSG]|nr:SPOR domain-containing protein [Roseomonas sp. ACRSG]
MSEAPIPSYRVRSAANEGSSTRMFMMAGGLAAVVGVGALVGWGITRLTTHRPIPVIEPDSRPVKIRPDDRGGLRVPNQDEIIFERRGTTSGYEPSGRLAPAAEAPNLDALRAATAPPPAPPQVAEAAPPEPAPPVAAPLQPAPPAAVAPVQSAPEAAPAAPPQRAALPAPAAPAGPAPVPATPAPAPRAAGGSVVVQLGALDSQAGALAEWERLARRAPGLLDGRTPQVIRFDRPDKPTMWRLRTGGFSAEAARDFCAEVRAKGGACAVIGG